MSKTVLVLGALLIFGVIYNAVVAWLQRKGLGSFTALQVVLGTLVTLAGLAAWMPEAFLPALACFAASGLFMFLGSLYRWLKNGGG
jgi:hypothetical protein